MEITYNGNTKERLDKFLQTQLDISRSQIKKAILDGQVLVNEKNPTVHQWLKGNEKISYKPKNVIKKTTFVAEPKIIAKTNEYLILDKPHNMLVHATDKGEINTLADWVIKKFPQTKKIGDDPQRPAIVHRLDKEVSGLIVIPLTQDSFDNIKRQFQDRTIKKEYLALIHGHLINDSGEITTPLERDKKTGLMKIQNIKDNAKIAHTTYQVIKRFINYTLVKVQIKTGRMHQIRAHFFSIGHSLAGDKLYQTKDLRKKNKVLDSRIFLHAHYLKLKDLENNWNEYESPLPSQLLNFLETIK